MIPKTDFERFIATVVASEFPEESGAYSMESATLIDHVYLRRNAPGKAAAPGRAGFGFAAEAEMVLKMIPLILASYKTIEEVIMRLRTSRSTTTSTPVGAPDSEALGARWREELVRAGLSETEAMSIVNKFEGQLSTLLRSSAQ
jgi:hypothetical protein